MNNPIQTVVNAVLVVAVAVLFYLHFSSPKVAVPSKTAPVAVVTPAIEVTDTAAAALAAEAAPEPEVATTEPVATPVAAPADGKIAYVESNRMLDGYLGMKDARRAFEAKARGWESQNQKLVTSFRSAVEAYQKQAASLTAEQRAATEQKLQAQQQQAGEAQQKLQVQAQEEEAKLTQTVLTSVNKKVEAYGKAHGYKLILIAAPSGTIAYGQKDLDITAPVLTYLNAEYRKK